MAAPGTYVGAVYYNVETAELRIWDGRQWVKGGGTVFWCPKEEKPLKYEELPIVMMSGSHNEASIYINGVKIPWVEDMRIEYSRDARFPHCTITFPCQVVNGLTDKQKADTAKGLRELLASLEGA